jgi:hypothetical protein
MEERVGIKVNPKFIASGCSNALDDREDLLNALSYAEAALGDIGDAEREPEDDLEWCERRAAEALPRIRDLLKAHGRPTSSLEDAFSPSPSLYTHPVNPELRLPTETLGDTMGDRSQISDGYHTFAELYEHRHALCLALMRAIPDRFWYSRRHNDGTIPFGDPDWFIVGAYLEGVGPITYHLPIRMWDATRLTGATELENGKEWDGHSSNEVVLRLKLWAVSI